MPAPAESPLVLAKDLWGEVTEEGFTDEPTARAAAKQLKACWVLFKHTALTQGGQPVAHTYTELAKGGVGFAHGNIRKFMNSKHPATVAAPAQQTEKSERAPEPEPESPKEPSIVPSKSGKHYWDGGSWQAQPGQESAPKQEPVKAPAAPAAPAKAPAMQAAPAKQQEAAKVPQEAAPKEPAAAASNSSPFAKCCACFAPMMGK